MFDVILLAVKVLLIAMAAVFLGYKTGLFGLRRIASVIVFAVLLCVCSLDLYAQFFYPDITLLLIFKSSFLNFTLDFSFFLRIFIITLLLGLVSSVFGVKLSARIKTVRELCILALLIALTAVMAIYCTFRFGSFIKIPFKFIPVFVTSAIFGPLWGGIVGALGDILAYIIFPVGGAPIPQITMVEFLYGFTYGLFFFNLHSWTGFKTMIRIVVCVVLQIAVLNLWLTSFFLADVFEMQFENMLIQRAIPGVINMGLQLVVITVLSKYISTFRKVLK